MLKNVLITTAKAVSRVSGPALELACSMPWKVKKQGVNQSWRADCARATSLLMFGAHSQVRILSSPALWHSPPGGGPHMSGSQSQLIFPILCRFAVALQTHTSLAANWFTRCPAKVPDGEARSTRPRRVHPLGASRSRRWRSSSIPAVIGNESGTGHSSDIRSIELLWTA